MGFIKKGDKLEGISKKNCVIVILDENNKEKSLYVKELIINDSWISYKTSENWITIPTSRIIKIKEGLE